MARTNIRQIALTALLLALTGGALFAQEISSPNESPVTIVMDNEASAAASGGIIFSNFDAGNSYNPDQFAAKPVAGRQAGGGQTERWDAVRFIPTVDVQVRQISAAIGWIQGEKLVSLSVYDNDDAFNVPGEPLPGGGGSTRDIPDVGQCCQLTTVTLQNPGVTLLANTTYWLVGKPDDVLGPTFSGGWHVSNRGSYAQLSPPFLWDPQAGEWPAAQIRGKRVHGLSPVKQANLGMSLPQPSDSASNATIFSNLDRSSGGDLYIAGIGVLVAGDNVPFYPEGWEALPFTPKAAVHAKTLAAGIAWVSGVKKVNLGLYSDSGGLPGTPLPGGQGSTTDFPDSGECCGLAMVRLPAGGVALAANQQVWLVASPSNADAADFHGIWQPSNLAIAAYIEPEFFGWIPFNGSWFAAEIRGTKD